MRDISKLTKLNVGCGFLTFKDHVNLDIVKVEGVNVVHDLEKFPYHFKDDQFDEIFCSHVVEHIENIVGLMREFQRIGKKGAKIRIIVPYFASPNAWRDPTHKRVFTYNTFNYFDGCYYFNDINLKVVKRKIIFLSNTGFMYSKLDFINYIINIFPQIYERFFCYTPLLTCSEIHYLLEVQK